MFLKLQQVYIPNYYLQSLPDQSQNLIIRKDYFQEKGKNDKDIAIDGLLDEAEKYESSRPVSKSDNPVPL